MVDSRNGISIGTNAILSLMSCNIRVELTRSQVAGTFGPMASAFSICSLVVHWRDYIPPGGTEDQGVPVSDPAWYEFNIFQREAHLANGLCLLGSLLSTRFNWPSL